MHIKTLCEYVGENLDFRLDSDSPNKRGCDQPGECFYVMEGSEYNWYLVYCETHHTQIDRAAFSGFRQLTKNEYLVHYVMHE